MIIGIITYLGIVALVLLCSYVWLRWLKIEIYFLKLKLEDHPILIKMVDDVLEGIRSGYDIPVFYKSFAELNKNYTEKKDMALGLYIHSKNPDHVEKSRNALKEIDEFEKKWNKPFRQICKLVGADGVADREDFIIPRIELCTDESKKYGLCSFYATYFHELGHHIAIITADDSSEEAADAIGNQLVYDKLPFFFQLMPIISFRYRVNKPNLTTIERLRAYYQFWQYLRIRNKK